jgi:hypothetical protein
MPSLHTGSVNVNPQPDRRAARGGHGDPVATSASTDGAAPRGFQPRRHVTQIDYRDQSPHRQGFAAIMLPAVFAAHGNRPPEGLLGQDEPELPWSTAPADANRRLDDSFTAPPTQNDRQP